MSSSGAGASAGASGAAAGTEAGAAGAGAGAETGLAAVAAPLAAAVIAAYTGKKTYDSYQGAKGKGFRGGVKEGIHKAGILNAVPLLAQAVWLGGGLGGMLSSSTKVEDERVKQLDQQGLPEFKRIFKKTQDPHAWYNKNLATDFIGNASDGTWTNNKFAQSRDVNDLRPQDIVGYSAFGDKFGKDWFGKFSDAQRQGIAQEALASKAVDEGHGTININWNPELDAKIKSIVAGAKAITQQNGKGVQPIAQGMTPQSTANLAGTAGDPRLDAMRSITRSPGIALDGTLANTIPGMEGNPTPMKIPRTGRHASNYVAGPRR
jgi:hypothetical protein